MTNTFKKLAQGQLPSSAGVLYTVPSLTQAIVKTIVLSNTSVSAQTVTVYMDGIGASNTIGSLSIPAGGTATWTSNGWSVKDSTGATISTSVVALTGDVTGVGSGTVATTLATVNTNVGSFGTASSVGAQTVNAKGLTTAASAIPILITESQVTNLVTDLAAKQATGSYLTALTGDITAAGPGSAAATLATVNASPGTTGDASHTSAMTTNAKGLVTANTSTAIQIAESQVTNLATDLAAKQATGNYITALTGDATATGPGSVAIAFATVNANVGTFGSATQVAVPVVNAKGLVTGITNVTIAIPNTAVSGLGTLSTQSGTFSGTHSGTSSGTNTGDQTITLTGAVTGTGTGSFATTAATATANTIKANATSSTATPTDVALTANQFLARSSTGDIAAKTVSDSGLTWLILGSIAAQTAALNAATAAVQGMMSAQDKIRMGAQFDARADLGFTGDLFTTNSTTSASTGTSTTITDSANPFQPFASNLNYYVGKRITLAGAGASGAVYVGTITAIASAGSITVTPAISTTVTNRIASFGTDETTPIGNLNTLVNTTNALFPGIRITFGQSPTNAYGFPVPVSVTKTMQIEGVGSGYTADTGDYSRIGGTRLAWWGTSVDGGVAFGAFWTISPTGVQSIKRPAFRHCWLDCRNGDQNSALIGLKMASCQGWSLDEFFVMDPGAIGIWLDIATSPTEARDCTRGFATNLGFRCLDNTSGPAAVTLTPTTTSSAVSIATSTSLTLAAANGLRASGSDYIWVQSTAGRPFLARYTGGGGTTTLTGVVCSAEDAVHVPTTVSGSNVVQASPSNSCAIYLNGGSGANTCCNTFLQTAISHGGTWGPAAVDFGNSDSNNFQSCYINGGTRAVFGAAPNNRMTKPGVRFNGSNVANTLASRNNTFTGGDPGSLPTTNGGVENMGLTNAGALLVAPAGPNYWDMYQLGNGAPMPVVEQGASFFWTSNGGFREGGLNSLTANQALTAAVANVVNGCWVVVPPQGWQVGTRHRWEVYLSKTAVGTAFTVNVRQHSSLTAGGGTLIATVAFTGTGVIDEGFVQVDLTCNTLGGSGTALARYRASHNLATAAGLFTGAAAPVTSPNPVTSLQTFEGVMTMAAFNTAAPSGGPTFLFLEIVPTTAATVMTVLPPSGLVCLKHANP